MEQIRTLEECSEQEIHDQFKSECGIQYCPYCGKRLKISREQMIEFLDSGICTIECCECFVWGDF